MGTLVSATVSTAEFALRDTFEELTAPEFETMRVAAHDTSQPLPFLWATTSEPEAVEDALRSDATTGTVQHLVRSDGRSLFRIEWESGTRSLLRLLVDRDGTLLEADARDGRWEFRLLFPDHDAASKTYDRCRRRGVDLVVRRVKNVSGSMAWDGDFLSKEQHEALVTAFETDYYRVPRGVTQQELADQLGLSHQALSERLRRGHQGLISNTLCNGSPTTDDT